MTTDVAGTLKKINPKELLAELTATVTVRSGDVAIEFEGRPVRALSTVDEQTRTLGIVVEVVAAGQLNEQRTVSLRSGAYCEVILSRETAAFAIVVPRTAVRDDSVYLVNDSDQLERRDVQIRASLGRDLVVEGLVPGDRLVIQPPPNAAAGLLVRPPIDEQKEDLPIARAAKVIHP